MEWWFWIAYNDGIQKPAYAKLYSFRLFDTSPSFYCCHITLFSLIFSFSLNLSMSLSLTFFLCFRLVFLYQIIYFKTFTMHWNVQYAFLSFHSVQLRHFHFFLVCLFLSFVFIFHILDGVRFKLNLNCWKLKSPEKPTKQHKRTHMFCFIACSFML